MIGTGSEFEQLTEDVMIRVNRLCNEFEERWRRGEPTAVEDVLDGVEETLRTTLLSELLPLEIAYRRRAGMAVSIEQYMQRFPSVAKDSLAAFVQDTDDHDTEKGNGSRLCEARSGLSRQTTSVPSAGGSDGRFRVLRLFARGGIGQVMRAMDTELNREVAVKEIQPALAGSEEVRERFLREAEITGKLEHPGIVPVYGLGRDAAGRPFYAMRLVRGQSFHEAVEEFHRRPVGERCRFGLEFQKLLRRFLHVCETVAYAHSRGVIHRDIKPANILLGPFGETLVVDWGLARSIGPSGPLAVTPESAPAPAEPAGDERATPVAQWSDELTQATGAVIGTPAFMSPEQARGEAHGIGPASDVYSLGATLFMLLTARIPFAGSGVDETLRRVIAGSFTRPRELSRAIPPALEAVCLKAMARPPEDRYASPRELADDIEHWLADEPVSAAREPVVARLARWGRRHRTHVVAGSIALLLITVVAVAAAFRIDGERRRADRQRIEADRERIEANRRTARLAFDRGFALAGSHEYGLSMLWFARALQHAPAVDAAMRRVILTNLDAARHHLVRRGVAFNHPANISAMAFSPDGTTCLTTDGDFTARVWDADSGELKGTHKLGRTQVFATMIRDDGTPLVAVATHRTLLLKSLRAAADAGTAEHVALAHPDDLVCAAFSPDGSRVCTGSGERTGPKSARIRLWRAADGEQIAEFDVPAAIVSVTFQPTGRAVATLSRDGLVRLWNATDGRMIGDPLKLDGTTVTRFAFLPDGRRILMGGADGSLSCWNVSSRKRSFVLPNHRSAIAGLACASDGQTVVATTDDGTARAWNIVDGRAMGELLRLDRYAWNPVFRPGTRQMLVAVEPRSAVLWDIPDSTRLGKPLHPGSITSVAFSPDGKTAVLGNRSGTARLYDAATGRAFGKVMPHDGLVKRVSFRPSDGAVVLTASLDGTARLWNAADGEPRGKPMIHRSSTGLGSEVAAAVFSPDGRLVLTGDNRGVVRMWNCDTGEPISVFDKQVNSATVSVCFTPDGARVLAGFSAPEKSLRVWDSASGELLWTVQHGDTVRTVTVSPDGRVVMSASNDRTARFWDSTSGQPIGSELPHRGEVFVAVISPDGRLAVTGGYDATVRLWEVPSGRPFGEPMRHEGVVLAAVFSSDGKTLLTGSADRSARLWDVATCLPLCPPMQHNGTVASVALDPAGHTALTGRLWRLPAALPDDPSLVALWVKLATQRTFTAGDNTEWLDPAALADISSEFQARLGKSWSEWGN